MRLALLDVFVPGLAVAQGRPRAFKLPTGQIRVYDPLASRSWKTVIRQFVAQDRPAEPYDGAVRLTLGFLLLRPKSLPKRVREHTKRPDTGNLLKAVEDALTGVVYRDDAQIVELHVSKNYAGAPWSATPGVRILVERVE